MLTQHYHVLIEATFSTQGVKPMTTTRSTTRRLFLSGLIFVLILMAAVILDGPPTLTNSAVAKGDSAVLARYGYYGSYCYPHPYCIFMPLVIRQLVR